MRRLMVLFAIFALVVGACGDDDEGVTTTSSEVATTTAVVTTLDTTTTEATTTTLVTTTTVEETTTSEETTTTTLAPVTVLPGIPSAESRSNIPWSQVDEGWVVVRYDGTPTDFSREGPWIIYLVSPGGTLYEIRAFTTDDAFAGEVQAFSNNGRQVVLEMIRRSDWERRAASISLTSGLWRTVLPLPDATSALGTTLPTGRDVVIGRQDFGVGTDYLEIYRTDGTLFSSIASRPSMGPGHTWLYALDGTSIFVGDPDSDEIHQYSNTGTLLQTLNTGQLNLVYPGDCDPIRWWDSDTILAACIRTVNYQDLWLIELDGSSPTLITELASSPDVVEFGFADAWQVDGKVIVQRWGDCGARWVERLWPDTSVTGVAIDSIGGPWIHAVDGDHLIVHSILGCGDFYGPVTLHDSDGFLIRTLVPYIPGYYGVTSVAAMIPTP